MKVKELTEWLGGNFPAAVAEDWDNVGLLTGDDESEVKHVFLALDLTEAVLDEAIQAGADMIVTHHPMIFSGIKKINNHSFIGRKIIRLVRHGISYYAMHTNYDILGMADLSAGYLENLPCEMTLKEYALLVKKNLKLSDVKVYGNLEQTVKTAAVCTGSGKSMIQDVLAAGADVYVTGDIDHHTGIDTVAQGLAIIDAGHYGTEYIFMEDMKERLAKAFPELTVSCAKVRSPYTIL